MWLKKLKWLKKENELKIYNKNKQKRIRVELNLLLHQLMELLTCKLYSDIKLQDAKWINLRNYFKHSTLGLINPERLKKLNKTNTKVIKYVEAVSSYMFLIIMFQLCSLTLIVAIDTWN